MTDLNQLIDDLMAAEQMLVEYQDVVNEKTVEARTVIDQVASEYEPIMESLAQDIENLRFIIRDAMDESGDEKKRRNGKVVTLIRRPKLVLTDMTAAREYLTERDELAAYITLNTAKYIKEHPDGPGIHKQFTTYIQVSEDKL